MITSQPDHLLFIEPTGAPTPPIVDDITRKLTAAWRQRRTSPFQSRGQHSCTGAACDAMSDSADHTVAGLATNSLCIHYVAMHRAEVSQEDLDRIASFELGTAEPTVDDLAGDWRAAVIGEEEAVQRWHAARRLMVQVENLVKTAYQDLAHDADGRYRILRQAEDLAVQAGVSPRPDYMSRMGVNRAQHEDKPAGARPMTPPGWSPT